MRWRGGDVRNDFLGEDVVLGNNVEVGGEVVVKSCFARLACTSLENVIDWAFKHPDWMLQ